jgi:hypothetical protein
MNKELTWRILKAMNTLYEDGKINSTIVKDSQFKNLKRRKLIDYQHGNSSYLVKTDVYDVYFQKNFLKDFLEYETFLLGIEPEADGRKTYTVEDLKTLMLISNNKDNIKKSLTTRRTFSSELFEYGGSKYLETHQSLDRIVRNILEIVDFPSEDPKVLQWRFVVDCPNPELVVLCENLDFLKTPNIARQRNIELWYVGGNNTSNIHNISAEKLDKPLYYSCDWDYHGLKIYCRIKDLLILKNKTIELLFPSNLQHPLPIDSPNHKSKWNHSSDFSGIDKTYFMEKEIDLISQLIKKDQWIEEESNNLLDMISIHIHTHGI